MVLPRRIIPKRSSSLDSIDRLAKEIGQSCVDDECVDEDEEVSEMTEVVCIYIYISYFMIILFRFRTPSLSMHQ